MVKKKLPILICVLVAASLILSGCVHRSAVQETAPAPEATPSEEPVIAFVYPVLAVDSRSSITSREALIEAAKHQNITVLADGQCALAAAALCALEDIRFTITDSGAADAYVYLPDEVPGSLIEIGQLDMKIYLDPTDEQQDIYSQLEDELKYYLK